jgi:protein-S-isoprenylcysteine O-methyltransferase Ste14
VALRETVEQNRVEGIGCAWALLVVNTALMGLFAVSFVKGPYSSSEQELWYRYGSLSFFLAGAALPAIALFAARRSRWVVIASTVWMLTVLLGFAWFAMMSGGGV